MKLVEHVAGPTDTVTRTVNPMVALPIEKAIVAAPEAFVVPG